MVVRDVDHSRRPVDGPKMRSLHRKTRTSSKIHHRSADLQPGEIATDSGRGPHMSIREVLLATIVEFLSRQERLISATSARC